MEIVGFLFSINKISLIAFFIIGIFVVYQIYLLKKEILIKTKPKIPEFKEEKGFVNYSKVVLDKKEEKPVKKANITILIITGGVFIFLGAILVLNFVNFQKSETSKNSITPTPLINFVASSGIKIYNQNWDELTESKLKELTPGQILYIGIETVSDPDIDKARIRINKNKWSEEDITVKFNKEKKVFYRQYSIATGEGMLKIEGQLHSRVDGWLGE